MTFKVALSFSGGKDSCLALYYLQQNGIKVECLLTTVWKDKEKTFVHDQKIEQLQRQADALGIPLRIIDIKYTYEESFISVLQDVKGEYKLDGIAFGDIYLDGHREWGEGVAEKVGLKALYPLWRDKHAAQTLLEDFVVLGFKAKIIKVNQEKLPLSWIGREINHDFIKEITELKGVCPLGESGEYHTVVYDGPIFNSALILGDSSRIN